MWLAKIFKISDKSYINSLSQAGSIGLHMVSGIVVGALMGYFLDHWLGTSPWLTGIFLVLGIIAGFKNVYIDTKRLIAKQKEEDQAKGIASPDSAGDSPTDDTERR
jgi:ATP synthase protein I